MNPITNPLSCLTLTAISLVGVTRWQGIEISLPSAADFSNSLPSVADLRSALPSTADLRDFINVEWLPSAVSLDYSGLQDWLQSRTAPYNGSRHADTAGSVADSVTVQAGGNPFADDAHAILEAVESDNASSAPKDEPSAELPAAELPPEVPAEAPADPPAETPAEVPGDGSILVEDVSNGNDAASSTGEDASEKDEEAKDQVESSVKEDDAEEVKETVNLATNNRPSSDDAGIVVETVDSLASAKSEGTLGWWWSCMRDSKHPQHLLCLIMFLVAYGAALVAEYYILEKIFKKCRNFCFPQHPAGLKQAEVEASF